MTDSEFWLLISANLPAPTTIPPRAFHFPIWLTHKVSIQVIERWYQ